MNRLTRASAALAALATIAAPAAAEAQQRYPYPPHPPGGIAGEIERGARTAADAVTAVAHALRGTRESLAVGACRVRAARLGHATVTDVDLKGRRSLRVRGVIEPTVGYGGWGSRYDRAYARRFFTCTVRDDGRITRFKTKRLRR